MQTVALIVAAGKGERFGSGVPKQYACLGGIPILTRSIRAFVEHSRIDAVRVVIGEDDHERYAAATRGMALLEPAIGGATRQATVRTGLESLAALAPERVLIHDAARPLISTAVIDRVLDALDQFPAALPVLPVVDTLKRLADGTVVGEANRAGLGRAQTPQGFNYAAILAAHHTVGDIGYTDDTAIAAAASGWPTAPWSARPIGPVWVARRRRRASTTPPSSPRTVRSATSATPTTRRSLPPPGSPSPGWPARSAILS